jgi:hypothetical protein
MKLYVVKDDGVRKARIDFPTDDGTCLGKPVVCITLKQKTETLVIDSDNLLKICEAFKKEISRFENLSLISVEQ